MSLRNEKVASVIKRVLSPNISKLANESHIGLASVSMVKLSKDLSVANIFVNILILNSETSEMKAAKVNKLLAILETRSGMLRSVTAREVRMRFTPELRFFYDDTLEEMDRIDKLINKVKTDTPYKDNYGDEDVYDESKLID
jgi:ribosome-binding factor A